MTDQIPHEPQVAQEPTTRRLFIGNISAQLFRTPQDLTSRISRFGTIKTPFEGHFNEIRGTGFGYLDVDVDDKSFIKLKGLLNGVNFKGSKLVLDVAKDTFEKRAEQDRARSDAKQQATMLRTQWKHYRKCENIKMSFKDRREVIRGRLRASRRQNIKNMTLRVNFNGTVRIIKCHKQKLWGYEKNKRLRDLVYRFSNGEWKDGNDHIVERLSKVQLRQGSNSLSIEAQRDETKATDSFADEEELLEDEKNKKVLASLFGTFDFDKPLDYTEELDEFGGSDFEYNQSDLDNDNDGLGIEPADFSKIEYVREGEFAKEEGQKPRIYDENEDDDTEIYTNQTFVNEPPTMRLSGSKVDAKEKDSEEQNQVMGHSDEDEEMEEEVEEEEEFMPTFGQTTEEVQLPSIKPADGTISNTETLRTLFTTEEPTTFNLIEEDDDIDHSIPIPEQIQLPTTQHIVTSIAPKKNKRALFFPHLDSPFLVAQTQLSKLEHPADFDKWDTTFWEKRAEWTKDCKRRKRDVLRQMRKKNAKSSRAFV